MEWSSALKSEKDDAMDDTVCLVFENGTSWK